MRLATLSFVASSLFGLGESMIQGFDMDAEDFINWDDGFKDGARFATIRATAGDIDIDERFETSWSDAKEGGFIRGAYHEGVPAAGAGKEHAEFFLNHGGQWIADNQTLPGTLHIQAPLDGDQCFGLNPNETIQYLKDWTSTYFQATDQTPWLRIDLGWFDNCTDNWYSFPPDTMMSVIDADDTPPIHHDLYITYGVSWDFWLQRKDYLYGGESQMFGGSLSLLKSRADGR
ncbi:hypothetical protein FQN54_008028 [Arachnomyces sp. PD_36]|nr:hypothetical protein FQN54_008028 [Arachnomyces sp. PD_36]